jgi:hypothetical protein
MKLWRIRWTRHVARAEERRKKYRIFVGIPERKSRFEDTGVDGRIILKFILKKHGGGT